MRKTVVPSSKKTTAVTGSDNLGSLRDTVASIITASLPIKQIVLVTASSWTIDSGIMHLFSRVGDRWRTQGKDIPVMIGTNGLGWGSGIHQPVGDPPQKTEGDLKAPAGVFQLGSAFGYDTNPPAGTSIPYRSITEDDYYVDDVKSEDYNRWVRLGGNAELPERMWDSWEEMKRPDQLYELGVVVEHNAAPVVKGKGSAVFLHVWQTRGVPTAGCTAMAKDNLTSLIRWLKPDNRPCLIQVPVDELGRLRVGAKACP